MRLLRFLYWILAFLIAGVSAHTTSAQDTCALPPRLVIGQQGQVLGTAPNNLRAGPARSETLAGTIPGGGVFEVLAGPECDPASGIYWWYVDYAGQVGWTAEGDASTYFLEPIHPALLYLSTEINTPVGVEARSDLVLLDLVTGESRNLTASIPSNLSSDSTWRPGNFAWTPEGDRIAFTVTIFRPFHETLDVSVYLMNADGSGKCLLAENTSLVEQGVFALESVVPEGEDGAPLDFSVCENPPEVLASGWRVTIEPVGQAFAVNASTGERIQLTDGESGWANYGAVISPDGSTAAVRVTNARYESLLYLIPLANADDAKPVILSGEPTGGLSWSPTGDSLLIAGEDSSGAVTTLVRLDVKTGEQHVLYVGTSAVLPLASPTWSPTGEQIAFADGVEVNVESNPIEPRLFRMNADGSGLQQLDTLASFGPILWRPGS